MSLPSRKQTAALLSVALLASPVLAAPAGTVPGKVFDAAYVSVPPIGDDQAQVVYYRLQAGVQRQGSAHVYVDREFHTGLLPGGYSTFCLAPGSHTLGAYLDDTPDYKGKRSDLYQASLQGGKTYYLRVREDGNTFPQPVKREEAERELVTSRMQAHTLSRAASIEACRHYDYLVDESRFKHYELSSDVLFAFGKSASDDISAQGRKAVRELIDELQRDDAQIRHVQVVGHTDPIGDEAKNQHLGQLRANTLRELLIAGGIPDSVISAASAGNREPVVFSCYGNRVQQIACYAPNRRVVVKVELGRPVEK
ncbi:OmpA family protein [Pseudomonas sp. P42]|uniref:OmpA family protein n=1 Tax=Pseudomonas sp. P42 TaxID=1080160 RepID=UPI001B343AEC|nr:OmpA family protein [Pseudomonas sp. P42]MBP5949295.1 OmpA family protein [Pseudomonas sp. P42]